MLVAIVGISFLSCASPPSARKTANPSPPAQQPSTISVESVPPPSTEPEEAKFAELWVPPPFSIIARAPDERVFYDFSMDNLGLIAACASCPVGCIQPKFAQVLPDGSLVPKQTFERGLPALRYDNLPSIQKV